MLGESVLCPPVSPDKMSLMKKLIKKIKEKGEKDPANFSEEKLKKLKEKNYAKSIENFKKSEKQKKKNIQIIKKELIKYKANEKELLELHKTINKRFNVSKTETKAKIYGVASIYFNALKVLGWPDNYYPFDRDTPEMFITPDVQEDPHYWLWMFQVETSDNESGHTIPEMPGKSNEHVIHGFLFPMTSTTIHLSRFNYENQFGIIHHPNDELFGREWMSTYTENYFKTYEEAYKEFEKKIENHLEKDEEKFYTMKKDVILT